jgi:hypothetical protein
MNPIDRYGGKESEAYRYFASDFSDIRERHWLSIWHQAAPIILLPEVISVIEFGGGRDITRCLARHFGIQYLSVDISDRFFPDVQSSISDYPFNGTTYDLVCSFECLEHNPWEESGEILDHMIKFTRKYLYLSVPYSGAWFSSAFFLRLPKISLQKIWYFVQDGFGGGKIDVDALRKRPPERKHSGHWWEVGRPGLSRRQFIQMIEAKGMKLVYSRHNSLFPHHLFLLFERQNTAPEGMAT